MAEIVRDVTHTQQAMTTTPDYQSPVGPGAIISGVAGGLGEWLDNTVKSSGRGSGSGKAYNADLFDLYKNAAGEVAAKNMDEIEFQAFDEGLHKAALQIAGGDVEAMNRVMELAGYKPHFDNITKINEREAASDWARMDLYNTAGESVLGPDATPAAKYLAGVGVLNRQAARDNFVTSVGNMSSEQQSKAIDTEYSEGINSLYLDIQNGFTNYLVQNQGKNPVVMLNEYSNHMIGELANNRGWSFPVAQKVVTRALSIQRAALLGTGDEAKKAEYVAGLMEVSKDAMTRENELRQQLSLNEFLQKDFTVTLPGKKEATMKGADIAARNDSRFGNILNTLAKVNFKDLSTQIVSQGPVTYATKDLNFFLTKTVSELYLDSKGDPNAQTNISNGQAQTLETAIQETESKPKESFGGNFYAALAAWTDSKGTLTSGDLEDVSYSARDRERDSVFGYITAGTDKATDGEGFIQIGEDGQVHYYIPRRVWGAEPYLIDATQAGQMITLGDGDSELIRRNSAIIQAGYNKLEELYYYDQKDVLRDQFNRYQIEHSEGAQNFRLNQINRERGNITNVRGNMRMSAEDIRAVEEALKSSREGFSVSPLSSDSAADRALLYSLSSTEPMQMSPEQSMAVGEAIVGAGKSALEVAGRGITYLTGDRAEHEARMLQSQIGFERAMQSLPMNTAQSVIPDATSTGTDIKGSKITVLDEGVKNIISPVEGTVTFDVENNKATVKAKDGSKFVIEGIEPSEEAINALYQYGDTPLDVVAGSLLGEGGKGTSVKFPGSIEAKPVEPDEKGNFKVIEDSSITFKDNRAIVQGKEDDDVKAPVSGTVIFQGQYGRGSSAVLIEDAKGSLWSVDGTGMKSVVGDSQKVKKGSTVAKAGKSGEVKVSHYKSGWNGKPVKLQGEPKPQTLKPEEANRIPPVQPLPPNR